MFHESVSVMFTDIRGFTRYASAMAPDVLVGELDAVFEQFDNVCAKYGLEKLKTIGDSYMCGGGLPLSNFTHPVDVCLAALEFQAFMEQAKAFLEEIGRMVRVGGWELDLVKGSLYWSAMTKEIHEVPPDFQPDVTTAINFYKPGKSRATAHEIVERGMKDGTPWDAALELITARGREIWVRGVGQVGFENGKPVRLWGTFQDIAEQRRAHEALFESERELTDLFEHAPIGLHWIDSHGIILRANDAELAMLGYEQDEYLGRPIRDFHDDKQVLDDLLDRLARGETVKDLGARLRHQDGSIVHVRISGSTLFVDGVFKHTRCFTTNVTEQVRADETLVLLRQLENERMGRELHDGLGGHLTGVRYMLDSTLMRAEASAPDLAPVLKQCSALLQESVAYIRLIARGFEVGEARGGFESGVRSIADSVEAAFPVRCSVSVHPDFAAKEGETHEVMQILREAVNNAVRHGKPREIWINVAPSAITVENDGADFPSGADLTSGIGLASLRRRAEAIGGRFSIEARPQGGTTCRVQLRKRWQPRIEE